jgi:radical SAM superfamily enzyme YgiQ (UPF0313 family)
MASATEKDRKAKLDAESGTIHKIWRDRVRVALVYPNHYRVGMANLGFQTVYRLLNAMDHVVCERAFLPDTAAGHGPVVSLESGARLSDFHCIAFSLSFENDYPNILYLLKKAALPLRSALRGTTLPLVIAGGVAVFLNPEPLAPFFDCFLLGEAETLLPPFFQRFDPQQDRLTLLKEMAREVAGVYVPAFYREHYGDDGTLKSFVPVEPVPEKIKRVYAADLENTPTHSTVVTPDSSFDDAFLIEVSRGCHHGCRFCAAGYLYRPPRARPLPLLLDGLRKGAGRTQKIGLVGTAVSDLPDLKALCEEGRKQDLQLSFSSLRADALDDDLVAALRSGRLKTAAIAPETGSERMRRVVNKGLNEEDILSAAEKLVAGGIPNLKLYFMVGLPTEEDADIEAIVAMVKQIKHRFLRSSRGKGHMGTITVSLNSFVPKPFTPFQWAAMDGVAVLKQKIRKVKAGLKKVSNVRVHADVPRWSHLQALFARGDRRVSQMLLLAHENNGNWPQTFKASALNAAFFVHRQRPRSEIFPWDFIDHGIDRSFLWKEYQRALTARTTPPCPMDPARCTICGVCKPVVGGR